MWTRTKKICLVFGAMAGVMPGCGLYIPGCNDMLPPCDVSAILVTINEAATPKVPNQFIEGCVTVTISRTYASDAERLMIQKAENLASTAGISWASMTMPSPITGGEDLLILNAVTSDALAYYAKRALAFQQSETPENPQVYLSYDARQTGTLLKANGEPFGPIISLDLYYYEQYTTFATVSASAHREVTFNEAGEASFVEGDGQMMGQAVD